MNIIQNIKNTFFSRVLGFVLLFASSVMLSRILGPEGRGLNAILSANAELFSIFLSFNISQTLTYFVAKDPVNRFEIAGLGLILVLFGVITFLFLILSALVFKGAFLDFLIPKGYQEYFYLFFLFAIFTFGLLNSFIDGIWQGIKNFKQLNFFLMFNATLGVVVYCKIFFLNSYNTSLTYTFSHIIAYNSIFLLVKFIFFFNSNYKIVFIFKNIEIKKILLYCISSWSANVFNFFNKRLSIWFIQFYRGIESLGYFSLSSNLIEIIVLMIYTINTVISPYITTATNEDQLLILGRFSRVVTTGMIFFVFSSYCFSTFIIKFFYGTKFIDSVIPMQILSFSSFFLVFYNILALYNAARGEQKINLISNIVSFIIVIISNFILVPLLGVKGACISILFSSFLKLTIILFHSLKKFSLKLSFFLFVNRGDLLFLIKKVKF